MTWTITVPATASGLITLTLRRSPAIAPSSVLLPGETRDLGLKLIRLTILQARQVTLPPSARPLTTWHFGWNEPTELLLREGWGRPESDFVWAIGRTSSLELPLSADWQHGPGLVLLDMRPFADSSGVARQRIAIGADGRLLRYMDLRHRMAVALPVALASGATSITLQFHHLDAGSQPAGVAHATGAPFAWALSGAGFTPVLPQVPERRLERLLPAAPGQFDNGALALAVHRRLGITLLDLVGRFEGICSGCALGNLQRRLGRDPVGLLTYAGVHQHQLVTGLLAGFADLGRRDRLHWDIRNPIDTTHRMIDQVFELSLATPYSLNAPPPEHGMNVAGKTLPRLAEKLMEDVAEGRKIFVTRLPYAQDEAAALAVLTSLRHFGPAHLLWLVDDGSGTPGQVERLPCGLMRAQLDFPGTLPDLDTTHATLISVMANAALLVDELGA